MSAPAAAPTLAELLRAREDVNRQLGVKRVRLAAIPAERTTSRRAGDASAVLRLEVEAEELAREVQALEAERAQLIEQEQLASKREGDERERQRDEVVALALAQEAAPRDDALVTTMYRVGRGRGALESKAQRAPDRERARQVIHHEAPTGVLAAFATVAGWCAADPAVTPPWSDPVLDRVSGGEGLWLRKFRDAFVRGRDDFLREVGHGE